MKCTNCTAEMMDGYSFKVNTYGTVKIEKMRVKDNMPRVLVCPDCGKIEIFADVNSIR